MQAITNGMRKTVRSLAEAKYRRELGLFVAEGAKCVHETLPHFQIEMLLATPQWLAGNTGHGVEESKIYEASRADMERMTSLKSAPQVIAVYRIPEYDRMDVRPTERLVVALDRVQDPGNLGTIIRTCDWFGVRDILASADTVDVWNPKVVQSTMGSIARVHVHYTDLAADLAVAAASGIPVYGMTLDGDNIYDATLAANGIILMGNEGRGVGPGCAASITRRLFLPPFPVGHCEADSLNVSVATAITLAEFRRRQILSA